MTNVAVPTDPFACTRQPEWMTSAGTPLAGPPAARTASHGGRLTTPLINFPDSCDNGAGVKIYQNFNQTGNCARFIGSGDLTINNIQYPGASGLYIGANMHSMSTAGTPRTGIIVCKGGDFFTFAGGKRYNDLNGPDANNGHPLCDNSGDSIHIN